MYLNFVTGPAIYSGLLELVEGLGMTEIYTRDAKGERGKGLTYYLQDGDNEIELGRRKEWQYSKEQWEKILPVLNEYVKRELNYKSHSV